MRTPRKVSRVELDRGQVGDAVVEQPTVRRSEVSELLALPALLVPDLPAAVTLWLELEGAPARVQFTTRVGAESSSSLADVIVFDREELRALFTAAQADRVWRSDLLGLCFDKWRKPEHRVTLEQALAGANADAVDWSLGRVLARLGATVEFLEMDDAIVVRELSVAA